MPPVEDNAASLRKYASLDRHLKVVNGTIFGFICRVEVSHAQKSLINQHLLLRKHSENEALLFHSA